MKKVKLCILFLYHKADKLTVCHFSELKKSNPDAVIVPVTDCAESYLPGSIDVSRFHSSWEVANKWRSIDVTVYRWFENRQFDAEKYLFLEYDCLCTINLTKHYEEVWDSDVAGVDFFSINENPEWPHFRKDELGRFAKHDVTYASAIVPFTCTMFSHDALAHCVAYACRSDIFCELRMGTIVRKLGVNFKRLPLFLRKTICWHEYPWQVNKPGLFHSIKSLDHNIGKHPQPGLVLSYFFDHLRSRNPKRELTDKIEWERILSLRRVF